MTNLMKRFIKVRIDNIRLHAFIKWIENATSETIKIRGSMFTLRQIVRVWWDSWFDMNNQSICYKFFQEFGYCGKIGYAFISLNGLSIAGIV